MPMYAKFNVMIRIVSSKRLTRRQRSTGTDRPARWITKPVVRLLLATMAPWLTLTSTHAQSVNTYVSGKGNDSNPCSSNQPCKTLQVALTKTASGGQVTALDSANYGSVTINQAVSIISPSSAIGVLASSSISGIIINAGANDIINLQGLEIDGAGSGANGIQFTSGAALNIKDSVIRSFNNGINFQPTGSSTLSVSSTLITNNAMGVAFQSSTSGNNTLDNVQLVGNGTALWVLGTNTATPATLTLQNSVVANSANIGVLSGGNSVVNVMNSTLVYNGVGLQAQNAGALIRVSGSTVTGNATGWMAANGGSVYSAGANSIGGNSTGNSPLPTSAPPPPPPPPPPPSTASGYLLDTSGGYILDVNGARITGS